MIALHSVVTNLERVCVYCFFFFSVGWLPLCRGEIAWNCSLSHTTLVGMWWQILPAGIFTVLVKAFVFGGVCLEGLKISGAVKCSFFLFWVLLGFEEGKTCFFFLGGGKQGLEKTLSKVGICFLSKVSLNNLGFSFIGLNYLQI